MRAITICQPYAELIIAGKKRVENRTWPKCGLDYIVICSNGPLLIHAGKSREWLDTWHTLPDRMDFGAIIGMVELAGIVHRDSTLAPKWFEYHEHVEGPVCWILKNPRRFVEPIPYRGQQRIWQVPDEIYAPANLLPPPEAHGGARCRIE